MDKTTYKSYWKMVRSKARENTSKTLGIVIKILAIVVGLLATAIKSISSGGGLVTIIYDFFINFLIILFLWAIIWIGFFVYYRARKSVEIYNNQEEKIYNLESRLNKRVSVIASKSPSVKNGNFIIEQIRLINSSSQDLISCFALIESFYENSSNENILLEPISRNISWSVTGRRTSDNKVNLIKGIPENFYVARIDNDGNSCLMGEKGNNTPLDKEKKYLLQIRLVGDNFSPHTMKVLFECKKNGFVEITEVTNPSFIEFMDDNVDGGKLSISSQIITKRNWMKIFGFNKH